MGAAKNDRLHTIGETVAALREAYPDVSHSSLRFLEREGFIEPHRTQGGHRLYRDSDLDRIRLIKRWQAARLSLADIRQRLDQLDATGSSGSIAERYLALAMAGKLGQARQLLLASDETGMPLSRLFDEVLRPVLVDIGERWAAGTLTVAQEHELSEQVREIVAQLTLRHLPGESGSPVVVAACVAGELHDLGLRMVCALLRERGAQVHFLGADVEPRFIAEGVVRLTPAVVLLSVSLAAHLPAVEASLAALRAAPLPDPRPLILVGGNALSGSAARLAAPDVRVLGDAQLESIVETVMADATHG